MPKYSVGVIFHRPFSVREDEGDAKERYFLYLGFRKYIGISKQANYCLCCYKYYSIKVV